MVFLACLLSFVLGCAVTYLCYALVTKEFVATKADLGVYKLQIESALKGDATRIRTALSSTLLDIEKKLKL